MNKKEIIYVLLSFLVVGLFIIAEYNKPKPINWFPSYSKVHKIPFGTYVFHEQLKRVFSKEKLIEVNESPFQYLKKNHPKGTYLFINNTVDFDEPAMNSLLDWTASGNTLIVASNKIPELLLDTLHLKLSLVNTIKNIDNKFLVKLKNKQLDTTKWYSHDKADFVHHFKEIDTLNTQVISVIKPEKSESDASETVINTIKIPFENGTIILSTLPEAFTNYFILKTPNHNFTAGFLSYLNTSKNVYFDNHFKSGKSYYTSPLYVFLKAKELKWAYYIMLIGALFYIIFEGKRKQRAIPIVEPLKNKTLDFTRTIANMYYEGKQHDAIAAHKIQHFLDFIRTQLHLNTDTINDEFLKNLAARSNNTIEDTTALFKQIETISNTNTITTEALKRLNASIETYKSKNKWKTKI